MNTPDETSSRTLHLPIDVELNHPDDAPLGILVLAYYCVVGGCIDPDPEVLIRDEGGRWWPKNYQQCICIKAEMIKGWIYLPKPITPPTPQTQPPQ